MRVKREIEGRWWLNGESKPPSYGVLHFDPETGLTLEVKIAESFAPEQVLAISSPATPNEDIVIGHDAQDNPITLFGGFSARTSKSAGMVSRQYRALRALVGATFPSWKECRFQKASVHLSLLHEWLFRHSTTAEMRSRDHYHLTHIIPPKLDVSSSPAADITIHPEFETKSFSDGVRLREGHYLEFAFKAPTTIDEIIGQCVHPMRMLLSLFAGTPIHIDSIHLGEEAHSVELLMANRGVTKASRDVQGFEMQVQFKEIEEQFTEIVTRWFQNHLQMESAMQCYFTTIFNKELYGSHKFLLLAQALEVYHNSQPQFVRTSQPPDEFAARIESIIRNAPEPDRSWLKEKLHYANQRTLAERLDDILKAHPAEVGKIIPDSAKFAAKVRHTRNYYTHFDEDLKRKGKAASQDELGLLILQMQALLEICFLKDLGISGSPIQRIIAKCAHIKQVALR